MEFYSSIVYQDLIYISQMLKVIVLSGFLGSGKTTLVKNILTNTESKRIAVILNDISQFDIDTDFIKNNAIHIRKKTDIVQLSNGCVCCTLKDDMTKEVKKLAKSKKFDYLIIEATGVSTPLPVAQAFAYTQGINKITQVLGMITVVDAQNFQMNLLSNELANEEKQQKDKKKRRQRKGEKIEDDQKPTLAELMIDQLQIADLVIINKTDLVSPQVLKEVEGYIHGISPNSQIITSQYSKVNLDDIFKKRFDLAKAQIQSKWVVQRQKTQDIPETIKYNITSFVYRARRPFNPQKMHSLLTSQKYWPFWFKITRAKGFFWLANYSRYQFSVQKAGLRVIYEIQQPWYCQTPKYKWVDDKTQMPQFQKFIQKYFQQPWGDKRNQIIFISKDMNKQQIQQVLNDCLISEEELQNYEQLYKNIADPFKNQWSVALKFFQENEMLLQKEGDWQQVEDQQEQIEES